MAYARNRSVLRELDAGATDGKYKKVVADRGGDVEHAFVADRKDLIGGFYGIHEAASMQVPGTERSCANPYAVAFPCPDPEFF